MGTREQALYGGEELPLHMKDTDALVIEYQIAMGLHMHGNKAGAFLNNFETSLPGGHARHIAAMADMHDEPFVTEASHDLHSERAADVTYRTFFEDVDTAVRETGIDGRLLILRSTYEVSNSEDKPAVKEVISREALPVYSRLRQTGYSHYDLWR